MCSVKGTTIAGVEEMSDLNKIFKKGMERAYERSNEISEALAKEE